MSGKTHAIIGANAAWITMASQQPIDLWTIGFVGIGAFAALLPDIEATNAKIHHIGGGIFRPFTGIFKHRGVTHSLLMIVIIYALTSYFLRHHHSLLPEVITLAYASHPLIDGFNHQGVELFFPWRRRIKLLPKVLRTAVNGPVDQILFAAGACGVFIFLLSTLQFMM